MGRASSGSPSASARAASPGCGSASPPPARWRRAARAAARAGRLACAALARGRRRRRQPRHRRSPCSTPAAARSSPPPGRTARERARPRRARPRGARRAARRAGRPPAGGRGRGGTLPARSSSRPERPSRRTARPSTASAPRRSAGSARRGSRPTATRLLPDYLREPDAKPTPAMTAPPAAAIEVRRLTYADLPQVVAIERRAFPTPWSLAMFVLELSKPVGHLPRRVRRRRAGRLPRLLALRHGLAPHERRRRSGPAPRGHRHDAADAAARAGRRPRRAATRSRSGAPTTGRSRSTSASASAPPACGGATTRTTARTPWSCGARRRRCAARSTTSRTPRPRDLILALETSCDDTCAAVVTARRRGAASNVVSSQGVHDRFGGVVPEIASRHHLELVNAVVDDALARRARRSTTSSSVAVTQGPGLVGALLVGVATAKGLAAARRLPLAPVDHLQGHVAANFLAPEPIEPPFLCLIASGGHTLLARVDGPPRLRGARAHARRRGGRGVRQGRAAARPRLSGRPGAVAARRRRRPGARSRSRPPRACAGLDFSFAGLKTALLYKVRDLGEEEAAPARRRPRGVATSTRSSRR